MIRLRANLRFKVTFLGASPYGSGHINDTYCAIFDGAGVKVRYILQRINHNIFKRPIALMENIQRVTSHLAKQVAGEPDASRRVLTLIPTHDGRAWHEDAQGSYWRAYRFIERASTYDAVVSPEQAFQAAKAFGRFQQLLVDLPAPRLHDTIPDFHHTPKRFAALERAIESADARVAQPWQRRRLILPSRVSRSQAFCWMQAARARHAQRHQVQQRHAR